MKKYYLLVVAIVALVVMASGCTTQTGNIHNYQNLFC